MIFLSKWVCASDFLKIYHISHDMEMCRWFFQSFTEIQNGRHGSTTIFLLAQKLKKLVMAIFFNFNITFLATRGCASDFLKILPKFKMTANQIEKKKLSNFTIVFPTIWRCACDFFKVALKIKMAPRINFNFFRAQKLKKLKVEIIQILQSHPPMILRWAFNF